MHWKRSWISKQMPRLEALIWRPVILFSFIAEFRHEDAVTGSTDGNQGGDILLLDLYRLASLFGHRSRRNSPSLCVMYY